MDSTGKATFPNPFNPVTTLKYKIPKQCLVKITIYDNNVLMEETIQFVYDNKNSKTYKSYVDSSLEIFLKKETLFNGEGNPYIEAIIDGKDRVLEKKLPIHHTN